jgi:hypothetical protein
VFLAGDLLPHRWSTADSGYSADAIVAAVRELRRSLADEAPVILLILGNDDERAAEPWFLAGDEEGLWTYLHLRASEFGVYRAVGTSFVPPTPFLLKDWERYDVARYVDPGCVSPEKGYRSVAVDAEELRSATIAADLDVLVPPTDDCRSTILLAHSPPYRTALDRAALDGQSVDFAPLDVHVGSIAIRRFIEDRQPLLSLHGHIHESARLTGSWRDRIGRTHCFTAAHDGPELALVRFELEDLEGATRELL